jgi:hypothetical protein
MNLMQQAKALMEQQEQEFRQTKEELEMKFKQLTVREQELERQQHEMEARVLQSVKDKEEELNRRQLHLERISQSINNTKKSGKIKLNVGGTIFTTTVETLTAEKDTFFAAMVSDNFRKEVDSDDGTYFIDRNPQFFPIILDHLRGYAIVDEKHDIVVDLREQYFHKDPSVFKVQIQKLKSEALFYGMESLVFMLSKICRHCGADLSTEIGRNQMCSHKLQVFRTENNTNSGKGIQVRAGSCQICHMQVCTGFKCSICSAYFCESCQGASLCQRNNQHEV